MFELPNYDSNKPKQHVVYWDANNLYEWAMNAEEIDELGLYRMKDDEEIGYIYECDLEYPDELHYKYIDY